MFNIYNNNKIKTDFPIIKDNYHILHFDEEPILFAGSNKYGNKIIGSLIDEDEFNKFNRYFHTIVDSKTYFHFINKKLTYKKILEESDSTYIVDKSFTDEILNIYFISLEDVPLEYIPLEDSFCPDQCFTFGFNFILSLKGKLANMNAALPTEISTIQNTFEKILGSPLDSLKGLNLNPYIHQLAYTEGSFKLNFRIGLNNEKDFFIEDQRITNYLSSFFEYCMKELPEEVNFLFDPEEDIPQKFDAIVSEISDIYGDASVKLPENVNDIIKNEIIKTTNGLQQISENIGRNFTEIEVLNKFAESEIPIGFIDTQFKLDIEKIIDKIEELQEEIVIDDEPTNYRICIYHLNTQSRIGNAFIYNIGSDSEMSKPKIYIMGDTPLEETKFTESLYKNKWIDVKGIAKKIGIKFKSIELLFD